jgi:peptidoglycan/LPS O-acetylase OafA/YrhL
MVVQSALLFLGKTVPFPRAGACLFFVLSGYLITGLLLRSRGQAEGGGRWRSLGAFYARFWLRTWPVYLFVVALALASDTGPVREVLPWLLTHTVSFCLALRGEWIDAFSHFWVLSVEQQFALVWPLFVLFAPRRWLLPGAVALIAAGPLYRGWAVAHEWDALSAHCPIPACLDALGAGALLALFHRGPGRAVQFLVLPAGMAAVLLPAALPRHGAVWAQEVLCDLALALAFGWLVHGVGRGLGGPAGKLLGLRPLVYLGTISYGVYVYHALLPYLLPGLIQWLFPELELSGGMGPLRLGLLVAALVAVPVLSWHLLEGPINSLGNSPGGGPRGANTPPAVPRRRGYLALAGWAAVLLVVFVSEEAESWQGHANREYYARRAQEEGGPATGTAYYLSPSGDDDNPGDSPAAAWKSLARASRQSFRPGDSILLEGGWTFPGTLHLDADDAGTPGRPIVVGSYGNGRATIDAGDGCGVVVRNTLGVHVRNLLVVGSGPGTNRGSGIVFENSLAGDVKLPGMAIDRVEARGFGAFGVLLAGRRRKSGFRDVRLTHVVAHHNALAGIYVRGQFSRYAAGYAHEAVYVGSSSAHDNDGVAGPHRPNSGSGIVLSDVDGGAIERCVAHDNGRSCNSDQGGPVGIWAWDAHRVLVQHNESYRNRAGGTYDGGGFDLDGGVTDSVVQYNYSHDNDGPGYMLCQFYGARRFAGNAVRYNVSQDDGRKNGYGAIHLHDENFARGVRDCQVYHNTAYVSPSPGANPSAFFVQELAATHVRVRNNIFQARDGVPLITVRAGQKDLSFQGNDYFADGGPFRVTWEGETYHDLAAWRAATGQERVGGRDVGTGANPGLWAPGRGGTLGDAGLLSTLDAYRLREDSPLIGGGLNLAGAFGMDPGATDFFGNRLPLDGACTAGAHEPRRASAGARLAARPGGLVLGKWEGVNEHGKKEGIEFTGDGTFRISWEGTSVLAGRYRLVEETTLEVDFNVLYRFKARVAVTPDVLTLTVFEKKETKERSYRRVERFSFAGDEPAGGGR